MLSSVISSVGAIFIARLMGSDQYGLLSIVLAAPNLIAVVRNLGMPSAMVKLLLSFDLRLEIVKLGVFLLRIHFRDCFGYCFISFFFFASDYIAFKFFQSP